MENGDRTLNQWVDDRIARLEAPQAWRPNPDRGLAGIRHKTQVVQRRRWSLGIAGLAAIASGLFTIPGCQAATCKVKSDNLAERLWNSVFVPEKPKPAPESSPALAAPPKDPAPEAPKAKRAAVLPAVPRNFKESGSPSAAITCEIYTDYECPACARFYLEVVPQLKAEYVETGKVKLLHRDFPLSMHQYSRLAARYANAAGALGRYDAAVEQIFRTQTGWGLSGDVAAALAPVLAPEAMAKVRSLAESDPHLDGGIDADMEQGRTDKLMRTPSVVLVVDGQRRLLESGDYLVIKTALDRLLSRP
jgi:protein-disulfide isomerase